MFVTTHYYFKKFYQIVYFFDSWNRLKFHFHDMLLTQKSVMTGGGGRQRKFCLQPFGQSPHFRHSRAAISKKKCKILFLKNCFVLVGNAIIKPKSPCVVKTYTPIKPFFFKNPNTEILSDAKKKIILLFSSLPLLHFGQHTGLERAS